jgi:hypothetical protein
MTEPLNGSHYQLHGMHQTSISRADLEISYYLSILRIERSHPKNAKFFPKFGHRTASEIAYSSRHF